MILICVVRPCGPCTKYIFSKRILVITSFLQVGASRSYGTMGHKNSKHQPRKGRNKFVCKVRLCCYLAGTLAHHWLAQSLLPASEDKINRLLRERKALRKALLSTVYSVQSFSPPDPFQ